MRENVITRGSHYGRLAFVALVTAWLLAAVFVQTSRGPAGIVTAAAFALAAGFGLEFVSAVWTGRTGRSPRRSTSHS